MKKILFLASILVVLCSCKKVSHNGVVIDKVYTPPTSGTGFTTGGKMVFTSNSEVFTLVCKDTNGNIDTRQVEKAEYYNLKIGDSVVYNTDEFNF